MCALSLAYNLLVDGSRHKMAVSLVVEAEVSDLLTNVVSLALLSLGELDTVLQVLDGLVHTVLVQKVLDNLSAFLFGDFVNLSKEDHQGFKIK